MEIRILPGRIVYPLEAVSDPQNANPKIRPFILIGTDDELADGEPFLAVAVSTTIKGDTDEVPVPWSRNGDALTGFREQSVVKACWQEEFYLNQIRVTTRFVTPRKVEEIRLKADDCPE